MGQLAYYSQSGPDGIFSIDLTSLAVSVVNDTGFTANPGALAVTPDGSQIYFTTPVVSPGVGVCDASTGVLTGIPLSAGQTAIWVCVAGRYAYYLDETNDQVYQVSTATNLRTATIALGGSNGTQPRRISISPDGTFLCVSARRTPATGNLQFVTVISTSSLTVTAQIQLPNTTTSAILECPVVIENDTYGYVLFSNTAGTDTTVVQLDFGTSTAAIVTTFSALADYTVGWGAIDSAGANLYLWMSNLSAVELGIVNLSTFVGSASAIPASPVAVQGAISSDGTKLVSNNQTTADVVLYNIGGASFSTVTTSGVPSGGLALGPPPPTEQIVMIV